MGMRQVQVKPESQPVGQGTNQKGVWHGTSMAMTQLETAMKSLRRGQGPWSPWAGSVGTPGEAGQGQRCLWVARLTLTVPEYYFVWRRFAMQTSLAKKVQLGFPK